MTFVEAVKSAYKNYFKFSGRARRSEYWYFMLLVIGVWMLFSFAGAINAGLLEDILLIVELSCIIPAWSLTVRRLHDIGKPGWYVFVALIPVIGGIIILKWAKEDSQVGENIYGPNPKGVEFSSYPSFM